MKLPRRMDSRMLVTDKVIVEGDDELTILPDHEDDSLEIYMTAERGHTEHVVHSNSGGMIIVQHSSGVAEVKLYVSYLFGEYYVQPHGMNLTYLHKR